VIPGGVTSYSIFRLMEPFKNYWLATGWTIERSEF
jgi:hypothetical protein